MARAPFSFVLVFADDAQRTPSSAYDFITTSTSISDIPLLTQGGEEDEEIEEDQDETEESTVRIAFVKPSFTYAAYQISGFYAFYLKAYDQVKETKNVTIDLHLLTVEVPDETCKRCV